MQVNVTTVPAVFTFAPDLTLRVYDTEGNPWFVAVDIERMFGISNIRKRVASLDEDERSAVPAPQGGSTLTVVNESGLWTLVLRSDAALQKVRPHTKHASGSRPKSCRRFAARDATKQTSPRRSRLQSSTRSARPSRRALRTHRFTIRRSTTLFTTTSRSRATKT